MTLSERIPLLEFGSAVGEDATEEVRGAVDMEGREREGGQMRVERECV